MENSAVYGSSLERVFSSCMRRERKNTLNRDMDRKGEITQLRIFLAKISLKGTYKELGIEDGYGLIERKRKSYR